MKTTNILLGIIAILLALNCFYTYRSALVWEIKPYYQRTDEEKSKCLAAEAQGTAILDCPHGWYLKGTV
jgi:hypothetical protein